MIGLRSTSLILACLAVAERGAPAADWIRAGLNTNQPIWGLRGGLVWGLPPAAFRGGEPRGLIRLGYPVLSNGASDLINFLAIEPVVRGRKGFSELERSQLDRVPGKRLWAVNGHPDASPSSSLAPGRITRLAGGGEQLDVRVRVERFENGAHVSLTVSQRSDAPDEIELRAEAEPDSAPMEYCILTATMGNLARTRQLWLEDETVSSLNLYAAYRGDGFAPHTFFPVDRLHRTAPGDLLVAVTTDEEEPASVFPFPRSRLWHYGGRKVTQYWRKPAGSWRDDLQAAVNGRFTYWMSRRPIPGGVAFENFEWRERWRPGQRCAFGITGQTPGELGFRRAR